MDRVTASEAAKLTGKGSARIRQWANHRLRTDPKAQTAIITHATPKGRFHYSIDKDYLFASFFPMEHVRNMLAQPSGHAAISLEEVVELLTTLCQNNPDREIHMDIHLKEQTVRIYLQ